VADGEKVLTRKKRKKVACARRRGGENEMKIKKKVEDEEIESQTFARNSFCASFETRKEKQQVGRERSEKELKQS
jgi:hypothetical protein